MNFTQDEYDPYLLVALNIGDTDEEGRPFLGYQTERLAAVQRLQKIAAESFGVRISTSQGLQNTPDGETDERFSIITLKARNGATFEMFSSMRCGGLHAMGTGAQLLAPWDFSIAKYKVPTHPAAREYVRRKLQKFSRSKA